MHLSAVWFPHNWSKSLSEFKKKWRHKFIYSIFFCGMLWLVVELSSTLNIGISVSGFARVAHDWMCQKRGLACLDFWLLNFCRIRIYDARAILGWITLDIIAVRSVAESRPSLGNVWIFGVRNSESSAVSGIIITRRPCGEFESPNPWARSFGKLNPSTLEFWILIEHVENTSEHNTCLCLSTGRVQNVVGQVHEGHCDLIGRVRVYFKHGLEF